MILLTLVNIFTKIKDVIVNLCIRGGSMKRWMPAAALAAVIIYVWVSFSYFDIDVPGEIYIEEGSGFCVDDYIDIRGNKENITLEYRDDIDVNIPGTYSLYIRAEDDRGKTVEKTVNVTVTKKGENIKTGG